ncbi:MULTISPECIES: DUF5133 domain-containing protein [unclassified Streptomyces]|uniref:DUF5133 domain-containing protein n=1 Tax=unclassified Streptomyces TaxID=2593676 RepID=UPI0037998B06
MLMAHPTVLLRSIEQDEVLRALHAEGGGAGDAGSAPTAARHRLPGVRPEGDAVVSA